MSSTFGYHAGLPAIRREGQITRRSAGFYLDMATRPDMSETADSNAFLISIVDGGVDDGETITIADDERGGMLQVTTNNADNDLISIQANGEAFSIQNADDLVEYEIEVKVDDVSNADVMFGFAVSDTNPLDGVTDGVFFRAATADGNLIAVNEKDSTETTTDTGSSMSDDTLINLRIEAETKRGARFYIDGTEVATQTANLPDDELLSPFFVIRNASAAARTIKINHWAAFTATQ